MYRIPADTHVRRRREISAMAFEKTKKADRLLIAIIAGYA
jgi:hypothetical protein